VASSGGFSLGCLYSFLRFVKVVHLAVIGQFAMTVVALLVLCGFFTCRTERYISICNTGTSLNSSAVTLMIACMCMMYCL